MTKAAFYARLSKEDLDKRDSEASESIQNQIALLYDEAAARGFEVCDVYSDDDYSGGDRSRPAFRRILKDAKDGKFDVIMCKSQSRFARDIEMVERYINGLFPLWGIRFISITDHVDTNIKGNRKQRQINALVDEWYLENVSENIKASKRIKAKQGKYVAAWAPYGYRKDPADNNHLLIDEETAPIVRNIFQWYLSGDGKTTIVHRLNRQGIPTPSAYKFAKGIWRGTPAPIWRESVIKQILQNAVYTGDLVQGKRPSVSYKAKKQFQAPRDEWIIVRDTHEAIIPREDFETVQAMFASRSHAGKAGTKYPLSGLVYCADCGQRMQITSNRRISSEKVYHYLQCRGHIIGRERGFTACSRHSVRMEHLLERVEQEVKAHITAFFSIKEVGQLGQKRGATEQKRLLREAASLETQTARHSKALQSLYLDKVDGNVDPQQYAELNAALLEERNAFQSQLRQVKERLQNLEQLHGQTETVFDRAKVILYDEGLTHELAVLLIDRVEVSEKDPVTKQQAVTISWKI